MNTLSLSFTPPAKISITSHPDKFFANTHRNNIDSVSIARPVTITSSWLPAAKLTHVTNSVLRTDYLCA
ncbi:hypothetical protein PAXRUDRAFT_826007 [Paxillus rubicundulus Ve08.2h10]|uniref:Unplaced genomic scaffold scaffold_167, whole genome shotgun sequence n=1 Tax=Paxillus rubicundulus Ve08.2h10 TaxID=930991 RepID=A0A0D0EA76_9AGAM|nr:hypothetical protein PAXRUDRAFT_826007 [Paxillus rubicundulus Ve08.2h10]